MELLGISVALGVAGLDIFGMALVIAARAAGVSRRKLVWFGVIVLVGTVLLGVGSSLLLGDGVRRVSEWLHSLPDMVWIAVNVLVSGLLLWWAGRRLLRRYRPTKQSGPGKLQAFFRYSTVLVAALFALSALTDPAFLALIALTSRENNLLLVSLAHLVWIIVSQFTLFAFLAALCGRVDQRLVGWVNRFRSCHQRTIGLAITSLIIAVAGLLMLDIAVFLTTESWLLG